MELFIIRHGIAEPRADDADDAARELTRKGRRRFEQIVRGLGAIGVRFDRVLHSPWTRAVQTAELLAPLNDGALTSEPLLAKPPSASLVKNIARHARRGPIAAVGHEPWLTELAALLMLGPHEGSAVLELKKGGVLQLAGDVRPGGMTLTAHLPPRVLRSVTEECRSTPACT